MKNFRASIDVMPHDNLLDPQGKAVTGAMPNLGLAEITGVRIGKHITLHVEAAEVAQLAGERVVALGEITQFVLGHRRHVARQVALAGTDLAHSRGQCAHRPHEPDVLFQDGEASRIRLVGAQTGEQLGGAVGMVFEEATDGRLVCVEQARAPGHGRGA